MKVVIKNVYNGMNFKQWLETNDPRYDSDALNAAAEKYFSIGHGDFDDESGLEPAYIVWVIINGEVKTSKRFIGDGECRGTHGTLWGHSVCERNYKGRYEPQTGRVSIVAPKRINDQFKGRPDKLFMMAYDEVVPLLEKKFRKKLEANKISVF